MAAALPAVDLRPRPLPPDLVPPPDPLGRPRLRPDRPLPGLTASEAETPEDEIQKNMFLLLFVSTSFPKQAVQVPGIHNGFNKFREHSSV